MTEKRIRKLTVKGMAMYEDRIASYDRKLETSWESLLQLIKEDISSYEASRLEEIHTEIVKKLDIYNTIHNNYCEFLQNTNTAEAKERLQELLIGHTERINTVTYFRDSVTKQKQLYPESGRSSNLKSKYNDNAGSVTSRSTVSSRAKAVAAQARLRIAEQEAALQKRIALMAEQQSVAEAAARRQRIDVEIELQLLREKKEAAEVLADADVLAEEQLISTGCGNSNTKVADYIKNMTTETHLNPEVPALIPPHQMLHENEHTQINQFSQFLLKKEILLSRFTKFDDMAESFLTWKNNLTV